MASHDLSVLVARLRQEGFEARCLGSVGITIWGDEGKGVFIPAEETGKIADLLARRAFDEFPVKRSVEQAA
jgi:hypothetical protein